ncbi:MAG TPA: DUF72 domain-containing protein [Actinomycetota bacterium]|jgi:uncharacterized protein YecE (DUF72 family)|nr:DUF72 domain-containing protein [Actinomycetota bacterium]
MTAYVGTSGWQYKDWKERFYPKGLPQREWLPFFSERFRTVEINNTFYNLPAEETFATWRRISSDDFVITIKASRYITHIRRLRDGREPVRLLWSRCRRLGRKLGAVLFQLPPNLPADVPRLRSFLRALPPTMRPAFEFRHESWDRDEVYEALDERGCALVLWDRPGIRLRDTVTGGWSYIRFHQGTRRGSGYTRARLRRWADHVAGLHAEDVFIYFNNDPGGAAVRDAATMMDLLGERDVDVAA